MGSLCGVDVVGRANALRKSPIIGYSTTKEGSISRPVSLLALAAISMPIIESAPTHRLQFSISVCTKT